MNDRVFFPKHLDKTRMFGPLELDEAAFIIVGVGVFLPLGFALGWNVAISLLGGLTSGIAIALAVKGIKSKYAEGYIFHRLYSSGLRHPHEDSPAFRVSHPHLYKDDIHLMPQGYFSTLVG